jgi:sugar fermentation stimulation protein A
VGLFPDAVTARGARHVRELTALQQSGSWAAAVLFVLQRADAECVLPDAALDPDFARAVIDARRAGVRLFGRRCLVDLDGLTLGPAVPVVLRRPGS